MHTSKIVAGFTLSTALLISSCGGGGGSGGGGGGATTGDLNIAVTDAPVDGVTDVWVEFTGVTLKPANDDEDCVEQDYAELRARLVDDISDLESELEGLTDPDEIADIEEEIRNIEDDIAAIDNGTYDDNGTECEKENGGQLKYTFDEPRSINLKELVDGKIELLFDEEVPAGRYNWMKLHVNAQFDGIFDSYVNDDEGGQIELRVPPDRLKLGNGFVVTEGGQSQFVIDWNLRMGLTNPVGQPGYKLKPSLRITDMSEFGSIEGVVAADLLPPINEDCSSDLNNGNGNVVYVYEGSDITPDDIDNIDPDPLTTADVKMDFNSGEYEYRATFLPPGPYTVAFTCQAADDVVPDPELPDQDADDDLAFTPGLNRTVVDGQTATANF